MKINEQNVCSSHTTTINQKKKVKLLSFQLVKKQKHHHQPEQPTQIPHHPFVYAHAHTIASSFSVFSIRFFSLSLSLFSFWFHCYRCLHILIYA